MEFLTPRRAAAAPEERKEPNISQMSSEGLLKALSVKMRELETSQALFHEVAQDFFDKMPQEILEQTDELEGTQRHVRALTFLAKMIAADELMLIKKPTGIRARRVWT